MIAQRLIARLQPPPAWRQRADGLARQAAAWWAQHPRHERVLLAACAALVLVILVWLMILKPAWTTLAEAREQLPQLRSEMVQVQAIAYEAQSLQRGRSGSVPVAQVSSSLDASLRRAGLDSTVSIANAGPQDANTQRWEIVADGAPAARLVEWLADLPFLLQVQTQSVELARTSVDGRDRPGAVSGRIALIRRERPAR